MMLLHFDFCEEAVSGFYLFSCRYSVTTTSVSVPVTAVFGAPQVPLLKFWSQHYLTLTWMKKTPEEVLIQHQHNK